MNQSSSAPFIRISQWRIFYVDGKVVWQPDANQVVIDDLQTRRRRICAFDGMTLSSRMAGMRAASNKVIVLYEPGGARFNIV